MANSAYGKSTGIRISATNVAATSRQPPTANGRAPNRSDRMPGHRPRAEEARP